MEERSGGEAALLAQAWSVGIDIGHGETAAARMSLRNLLVGAEVSSLELDNRKSIITAVAHTPGGEVLLGKTALIRDDALDVRAAFKAEPARLGPADRRALQTFFRAVCDVIDPQNGGLLRRGDAAVHVGVPSGWSAEAAAAYRDLLRNDVVAEVTLVPESRAALLHALEVGLIRRSEVERTVLVIDVGSLTTDFTVVADLQARPSERGHELGAGLIDRSTLRWVLDHSPDRAAILAAFEVDPSHRARCEIACREAKVRFFDPSFERAPNPRPIFVLEVIDVDLDVQARLTREAVREIVEAPIPELGGRSWPRAFREAVDDVRAESGRRGIQIELVLLTGGPSRMGFVQAICRAVFGDGWPGRSRTR
jgi:molecular chaperone DnaK (HSP70)